MTLISGITTVESQSDSAVHLLGKRAEPPVSNSNRDDNQKTIRNQKNHHGMEEPMEEDSPWIQQTSESQKDLSLSKRQLENPSRMASESSASSGKLIPDYGGTPTLTGLLATGIGQPVSGSKIKTLSNGVVDGTSNGSSSSEKSNRL